MPYTRQPDTNTPSPLPSHQGAKWLTTNSNVLPKDRWIAANSNGIQADAPTIGELFADLLVKNPNWSELAIIYNTDRIAI